MAATITTDLDTVVAAAAGAAAELARATDEQRAHWLEAVADALDAAADELVPIAVAESHLPQARLAGEVGRTTGQLRLFAAVVRDGAYLEAIIDHADAGRDSAAARPATRPDTGRPVAVYSACNFPFAFWVAGGDTASALAAGCPVVVKAHPGHPELSRRTAEIVAQRSRGRRAGRGRSALVEGREAGTAWCSTRRSGPPASPDRCRRPGAVRPGGRSARADPVLRRARQHQPGRGDRAAVEERGDALAKGLVGSFTLGAGQFCTKPGVVFVPAEAGFEDAVASAASDAAPATLLNDRIGEGFADGLDALVGHPDVEVIAGTPGGGSVGRAGTGRAGDIGRRRGRRPGCTAGRVLRPGHLADPLRGRSRPAGSTGCPRGLAHGHCSRRRGGGRARVDHRPGRTGRPGLVRWLADRCRGDLVAAARRPMARRRPRSTPLSARRRSAVSSVRSCSRTPRRRCCRPHSRRRTHSASLDGWTAG